MAIRTVKIMGNAYGINGNMNIRVSFNGSVVFESEVPTVATPVDLTAAPVELGTFSLDTSLVGSFPLVIEATNGTLRFNTLIANYTGFDFLKDGNGAPILDAQGQYQVTTQPVDYYGELNINTDANDGKTNVSITGEEGGEAQIRNPAAFGLVGEWTYTIPDGQILTCDYRIDQECTWTAIPTPSNDPIQ